MSDSEYTGTPTVLTVTCKWWRKSKKRKRETLSKLEFDNNQTESNLIIISHSNNQFD